MTVRCLFGLHEWKVTQPGVPFDEGVVLVCQRCGKRRLAWP